MKLLAALVEVFNLLLLQIRNFNSVQFVQVTNFIKLIQLGISLLDLQSGLLLLVRQFKVLRFKRFLESFCINAIP